MKLIFTASVALCFLSFQTQHVDTPGKVKQDFTPPNCVWLRDNEFIDKTEISNTDYREYLGWLKKFRNDSASSSQYPDTLVWRNVLATSDPLVKFYFTHPAYSQYPVVGITFDQAVAYCQWRSDRSMELLSAEMQKHPNKKYPIKIVYHLPAKEEWEFAASAGLDLQKYPLGFENVNGKLREFTVKFIDSSALVCQNGKCGAHSPYTPASILSGEKNKFGCYNMIGNVAEMISEKGICKGGSFHHLISESSVRQDISYEHPEAWLGFRCLCEVYW